jgi:AcrR family transcriptional regulator
MAGKQANKRSRGRPPGPSADGERTRERLFEVASVLIAEAGYEATTLRQIAEHAGVSVGNVYHYFPSKDAVALELYDRLSTEYAERASCLPEGTWVRRALHALRCALEVLGPHRETLSGLLGILLGDAEKGLLGSVTGGSRARVMQVFERAVNEADDAPADTLAQPIARLAYLAHMAVLLFWLLDRSPDARATERLLETAEGLAPLAPALIRTLLLLPMVRDGLREVDATMQDALGIF